jgi:hypothetical protein
MRGPIWLFLHAAEKARQLIHTTKDRSDCGCKKENHSPAYDIIEPDGHALKISMFYRRQGTKKNSLAYPSPVPARASPPLDCKTGTRTEKN